MKKLLLLLALLLTLGHALAEGESPLVLSSEFLEFKGHVTLYWQDDAQAPPYKLTYQYAGETLDRQTVFVEEGIEAPQCTLDYLLPGGAYTVTVTNSVGDSDTLLLRLSPVQPFADGKLAAKHVDLAVSPRLLPRQSDGTAKPQQALFNAADMVQALADSHFGVRMTLSYPELAVPRAYETQIAFQAPGGFLCVYSLGTVSYESYGHGRMHLFWPFLGGEFFDYLYSAVGTIPPGLYTVTCYWDGMEAAQAEFRVK